MKFLIAATPFLIGTLLKIISWVLAPRLQDRALNDLFSNFAAGGGFAFSNAQRAVLLKTISFSTIRLSIATTLLTSLAALLVAATRYPGTVIWSLWIADLLLSLLLWLKIRKMHGAYEKILGQSAGDVGLVLAILLDILALIPTLYAVYSSPA